MSGKFRSDFEVFGIVQGVFFRKYTRVKAIEYNVRGWCKNTSSGTVTGQMEGDTPSMRKLQDWMRNIGTPTSKVDKVTISPPKAIDDFSYTTFEIRK